MVISYATTLASILVFLSILLFSKIVFTIVILKAEILSMSFWGRFAFTVGSGGAFLLFRGVYLVLDDVLAVFAVSGLLLGRRMGLNA